MLHPMINRSFISFYLFTSKHIEQASKTKLKGADVRCRIGFLFTSDNIKRNLKFKIYFVFAN